MKSKSDLRKEFLAKRKSLEASFILQANHRIRLKIARLAEWEDARTILSYLSLPQEVETRRIMEEALGRRKRVVIPVFNGSSESPTLSEIRSLQELEPSPHAGLLQQTPKFHRPYDPKKIELAFIPGVSFDVAGGRLGFGGGYFDRLLPLMPQAVRVGLAFEIQISKEKLPLEPHDVRMHKILTEEQVILTRPSSHHH